MRTLLTTMLLLFFFSLPLLAGQSAGTSLETAETAGDSGHRRPDDLNHYYAVPVAVVLPLYGEALRCLSYTPSL